MISYPLTAGSIPTRVIEHGEGPAVLLLHGLGTRADRWTTVMEPVAATGRRVIAADFPGHGFAMKGGSIDYSCNGFARFVLDLLDALDIGTAALVGASLGGQVASIAAAQAPDRAIALALVGSTGLAPFGEEARKQMSTMLVDMSRDAIRSRLVRGLEKTELVTDELVEEDFRINNSPGAGESFAALGRYFAEDIDDDVIVDELKSLAGRIPVTLIWGEQDRSVSAETAREVAEQLHGVSFTAIPGAAHNPYLDQLDAFIDSLLPVLAGRVT